MPGRDIDEQILDLAAGENGGATLDHSAAG